MGTKKYAAFYCAIALIAFVEQNAFAVDVAIENELLATYCEVVPSSVDVIPTSGGFKLSGPTSLAMYTFQSKEAAYLAADIFEVNAFARICSVQDSFGNAAFRYLTNANGVPPGHYEPSLEQCESFLESKVRTAPSRDGFGYDVKSNAKVLVSNLPDEGTAKAIETVMKNTHMNARCKVAQSDFIYWKSLFNPPAPGAGSGERPNIRIKSIEWSLDVFGFQPQYTLSKSDARRPLPVTVSFVVENLEKTPTQLKTKVTLNENTVGSGQVTVPSSKAQPISFQKELILSSQGASTVQNISVGVSALGGNKSFDFSESAQFRVVVTP